MEHVGHKKRRVRRVECANHLCCVCGMAHGPGGCAYVKHFADMAAYASQQAAAAMKAVTAKRKGRK